MRLALIPPPKHAEWMLKTDYQLLVPSHFGVGNYEAIIDQCAERGDFIMLDNGAAEGLPIDNEDDLYGLANRYHASEVVIPDVYGNAFATAERLKKWKFDEDFRHMAVLAATSYDEVRYLADIFLDTPLVDTIGIPRLVWDHGIDRAWVAGFFHEVWALNLVDIHLLGTNPSCMWEMFGWPFDNVRGVDTSAPFVYGMNNYRFQNDYNRICKRRASYVDADLFTYGSYSRECISNNVSFMKRRVDGKETPRSDM